MKIFELKNQVLKIGTPNVTGWRFNIAGVLLIVMIFIFPGFNGAQAQLPKYIITRATILENGDTVPVIPLNGIEVFGFKKFNNKKEEERNLKLIRNVKKVYPYAKLAGEKLRAYNSLLVNARSEREKRTIMKKAEQEIKDKYGEELKKLNFTQGKILIKLIHRETSNTSFDLVKDLRGSFLAFFYQSFAKIFGYNLKVTYDANGEDRNVETIVRMIEAGVL